MKKKMGLIAVLSASILFTLGTAMTVCAGRWGWMEEQDSWVFYDKNGSAVTNQWKQYGNDWYWLGSDGRMATDRIVEANGDYFYVDDTGAMVKNQWVMVENTEGEEEKAPSNWWYYFGVSGKAFKCNEDGDTSLRVINGKRYAFDGEGKMLFGWVDESSARQTDEDAWTSCPYYFGDENDGAACMGWAQLHVVDNNTERWDKNGWEGEDQDYWFYFQSDGKKISAMDGDAVKIKTINGMEYGFDETGRMVYEWVQSGSGASGRAASGSSVPGASGGTPSNGVRRSSADNYFYFNDRDNGARVRKGWFKVVPDPDMNQKDYEDDEARWFYAYSAGKLCASEFRTIKNKRYCFDNSGRMLTHTQAVYIDGQGRVWNRKLDEEELLEDAAALKSGGETMLYLVNESGYEMDGELSVREAMQNTIEETDSYGEKKPTYGIYCFGKSEDEGEAKTGFTNVAVDGETYRFYFKKDGSKGIGWNGEKEGKLCREGKLAEADEYNRYEAYFIAEDPWQNEGGHKSDISSSIYQEAYGAYCGDDGTYFLPGHIYYVDPGAVNRLVADIGSKRVRVKNDKVYLVNRDAKIIKSGRKKDGDGCYYELKDGRVVGYYDVNDNGSRNYINYGDGTKGPMVR